MNVRRKHNPIVTQMSPFLGAEIREVSLKEALDEVSYDTMGGHRPADGWGYRVRQYDSSL